MKTKTIICAILSIVFISAGAGQGYQQIIDLGTLAGYPTSVGWSINGDGQIVGWAADNNSVNSRACIFDETGGGANINLGGVKSGALGSNGSQIVGETNNIACIFDSTGGGANISLGTLGGSTSSAQAINENGQIVGWARDSSTYWLACIFDNTGGGANKGLGTLGGHISQALANNNSKIVGYADDDLNYEQACIFDPTGDSNNNIGLGTLGGDSSLAWSINSNNKIVGWAFNNSLRYHACLFSSTGDGNNIDLGGLAADGNSEAYCINDYGQIVGYAENGLKQTRACLFDNTGKGNNIDLNTLIDPNSGWTLKYAFGIDNEGWIVGQGIHNGQTRAFLLFMPKPPEPPIKARVFICPRILNLRDNDKWIDCIIWLPKGFKAADIIPGSILLEDEIEAEWTRVDKRLQIMFVKFSRPDVKDIIEPGRVKLTVSGRLSNGRKFEGTDTITVISKCKCKHKHTCWQPSKKPKGHCGRR
jgi:probable HAF family extracellular repeat protein